MKYFSLILLSGLLLLVSGCGCGSCCSNSTTCNRPYAAPVTQAAEPEVVPTEEPAVVDSEETTVTVDNGKMEMITEEK